MKRLICLILIVILCVTNGYSIDFNFDSEEQLESWTQLNGSTWDFSNGQMQLRNANEHGEGLILYELPSFESVFEIKMTLEYGHNPSWKNKFLVHLLSNYGLEQNKVIGLESICIGVNQTNKSDTIYLYHLKDGVFHNVLKTNWNWNQFKDSKIDLKVIVKQNNKIFISINTLSNIDYLFDTAFFPFSIDFTHFGFAVNSTENYVNEFKILDVQINSEFYNKLITPSILNTQFLNCSTLQMNFSDYILHKIKPEVRNWNNKLVVETLNSKQVLIHLDYCAQILEQVDLVVSNLYKYQREPIIDEVLYRAFQNGDLRVSEILKTNDFHCIEIERTAEFSYDQVVFKLVEMSNYDTIISKWGDEVVKVFCNDTTELQGFAVEYVEALSLGEPIDLQLLNADNFLVDEVVLYRDRLELPGIDVDRSSLECVIDQEWYFNTTQKGHSLGSLNNFGRSNSNGTIDVDLNGDLFKKGNDLAQIEYQFPEIGWLMGYRLFTAGGDHIFSSEFNQSLGYSGILDIDFHTLSKGLYIMFVECFNLEGGYFRKKFPFIIY